MNRQNKIIVQILFYLSLAGIWQGIAVLGIWPRYLFPSPVQVWGALMDGISDSSFGIGVLHSMRRIVVGYGLSVIGGVLLGFLMSQIKIVEQTLGSLVLGLHTLPSICWLPVGILWFGLSDAAILLVIIMGSLFSITIASDDSVKNIPPIYVRAARTMGARGWRLYRDIIFPAALPGIVSGLKQGWSFAWRSLMAGELLFVTMGLGHLLQMGRELNDTAKVFAVMFVIIVIGAVVDLWVFGQIEKRIRVRWGLSGAR